MITLEAGVIEHIHPSRGPTRDDDPKGQAARAVVRPSLAFFACLWKEMRDIGTRRLNPRCRLPCARAALSSSLYNRDQPFALPIVIGLFGKIEIEIGEQALDKIHRRRCEHRVALLAPLEKAVEAWAGEIKAVQRIAEIHHAVR